MTNYNDKSTGKKTGAIILGGIAVLVAGAAALYLVDVDQTQEARLPTVDVDVSADSGQLPEFDVDVAEVKMGTREVGVDMPNVDVETKTIEVEVPVVDAEMKEKKVSVPTISIEKPAEDDPADNTK